MPEYTFDSLSQMRFDELEELYRASPTPPDLAILGTAPNGRMLAIRGLDAGPLASVVRAVARRNIWVGKKFSTDPDGQNGRGTNRMRLGREVFGFAARIGKSLLDGRDTVVFDYDLPENSAVARMSYNELREVSPGVFMGPVMPKTRKGTRTKMLWFALETETA